jgi:hypothetical protein
MDRSNSAFSCGLARFTDWWQSGIPRRIVNHPARGIVIACILAFAVVQALLHTWASAQDTELQLQPGPIAAAFALQLLVPVWVAPLWVSIVRALGGPLQWRKGIQMHVLANLAKYLPGKVMHAVGLVLVLQHNGISASTGVTSILVELALGLMSATFVSLLALPLLLEAQRALLVPIGLVVVALGLATLHPNILQRLLRVGARLVPGGESAPPTLNLTYGAMLWLLVPYAMSWVILALGLWATTYTIYAVDVQHLPELAGVVAVSYLFGLMVPFAPSGLGAREGLMALLLARLMPWPAAIAISIVYRLIGIAAEAVVAGAATRL